MNREQIQWVYNHVERITNKYLEMFPLDDTKWQQMLDEVRDIHKMTKENEAVKDILFAVVGYFDKLDVLYRRAIKDDKGM